MNGPRRSRLTARALSAVDWAETQLAVPIPYSMSFTRLENSLFRVEPDGRDLRTAATDRESLFNSRGAFSDDATASTKHPS